MKRKRVMMIAVCAAVALTACGQGAATAKNTKANTEAAGESELVEQEGRIAWDELEELQQNGEVDPNVMTKEEAEQMEFPEDTTWTKGTKEEVEKMAGFKIPEPKDASEPVYEYSEESKAVSVIFNYSGAYAMYQAAKTDKFKDVSGLGYEYQEVEACKVSGMQGQKMKYQLPEMEEYDIPEEERETTHVLLWYDKDAGVSYSLCVYGVGMEDFDILSYAESFL